MGRFVRLAVLMVLAGGNAGGAELRLREEATVGGGMVRLSDVAEITDADPAAAAALQRVLLFPAPGLGKESFVRRGEILELLALSEVDVKPYTVSGAEQIVIRRAAGIPPAKTSRSPQAASSTVAQSIEHALVNYLEHQQPGDVAWSVAPAIASRFVPPLQQAEQIIVSGGQAPFTGRQTFQIVARIQGHERRIPIEADVSALPRAVVAVRPIARGGVIRPEDIETKAVAADVVTSERLLARDEIVGREAIKGLIVGQPITASQVQLPRLVHRGDKVMVHSLAAGVSITTSGKATEDGALGEAIAVELEDPKRQIQARVAGPLRVEIGVAGTPHRAAAVEPPTAISLQPAGNTP